MPDISQPMQLATSTPQEAAEHIDNSNYFGVSPNVYKDYKNELQPEIQKAQLPTQASDKVASYVSQSSEHAALAAPDVEKLSYMDRYWKYTVDQVNKVPKTEDQISELGLKKMFHPDKFSTDDALKLFQLNEDAKGFTNYGLGELKDPKHADLIDKVKASLETVPAQALGQLATMGRQLYDSAGVVAAGTTAGIAIGAGLGLAGGPAAPATVPAAAIGGGITGFVNTTAAVLAVKGTNQQMGSTYNALSNAVNDKGEPLNMDDESKRFLSAGVGLATGAISAFVGRAVLKGVPFIGKLMDPKRIAQIAIDPTNAAMKTAITSVGKAMLVGGAGGVSQEAIAVVGEELARSYDGTEASFTNALTNASGRLFKAGAVGAATSGIESGVLNAMSFNATKKGFARANMMDDVRAHQAKDVTPEAPTAISDITPKKPSGGGGESTPMSRAVDVLEFDQAIDKLDKTAKSTNMASMSEASKAELSKVKKSIFDDSGVDGVYLDKEELTKWADDSKKAAKVLDILDPSGTAAANINAPAKVPTHKFLELVDQYPEASELAKLQPEGPSASQAKKFLEDHLAADQKRKEVLTKLGAPDLSPEERTLLEKSLETENPSRTYPSNDVFGEAEYLNQPTFTEAIESVLPKSEVAQFNEVQKRARQSVVDNINETAYHEMDEVRDVVAENALEAERESQMIRAENNPNLAIVDRFTKTYEMIPDERYSNPDDMMASHAKKGFSPLAIDPRQLPEELQFLVDNEQLKKHKVFVKGGISPDTSARLIGVDSGDTLLKILANTPSREDLVNARVEARKADVLDNAKNSVNLNETAIIQAYNATTANHIAEMNFLRTREWSATKIGIKRIALPLPRIADLNIKARNVIAKTRIGDLNVNQYKVGERKSQKVAVEALVKNEIEKAFVNKEAAALNSELTKEAHIATGKVNRVFKFARKFNKKEVMQELKDAGYEDAANEILDVFKLNPSKAGLAKADAFKKWAEKMAESGEGNFVIPEKFTDVRKSARDLTVEQVQVLGDTLKSILHKARFKNELYEKHEAINAIKTIDAVAEQLHEQAVQIFDYDPKKLEIDHVNATGPLEKTGAMFREMLASQERTQHLLVKMDNDRVTGLYNEFFFQPLKKSGAVEGKMGIELRNQLHKIIEQFGTKEFENLNRQFVVVPEFKTLNPLKNKKSQYTKGQLLKLLLNAGNEGNIEALERSKISFDTHMEVFQKHLDFKHVEFAQRIWDTFKSYEGDIAKLQMETEGTEVDFVKPKPLEFTKDGLTRVFPGGYYPIQTVKESVKQTATKVEGSVSLNKEQKVRQNYYGKAMTEQGHLESRTGNTDLLNMDLNGIGYGLAQVIHDISYRKAIRDTGKLLANEMIRNDIASVLGPEGYKNIAETLMDTANSVELTAYNRTDGAWLDFFNAAGSGFHSVALVGKISSLAIQPASMFFAIDKMGGPVGVKYLAKSIGKFTAHPTLWGEFFDFAADIHPPIRDTREDMEGDVAHEINKLLPKNGVHPVIDPIIAARDFVNEKGFAALGSVDQLNKMLVVNAAYMQAINGEAPNIKSGDHEAAKTYAGNIAELTQTHGAMRNKSPIQKNQWLKWMLYFYNDANNVFNSTVSASRKVKKGAYDSYNKFKSGDSSGGTKAAGATVAGLMGYLLVLSASKFYENLVRGQATPLDSDPENLVADTGKFLLKGSLDNVIGTQPIARDMGFAADYEQLTGKKKDVSIPILKMATDVKNTATGLYDLLDLSEKGNVDPAQMKSFLYTAGYIAKFPADAIYKYFIQPDYNVEPKGIKGEWAKLSDKISKYLEKAGYASKSKPQAAAFDQIPAELEAQLKKQAELDIPQEFLEKLEQIQQEIDPTKASEGDSAVIPPNTLDVIKDIESKGKWWVKNPNSTAAGLYQFTESTWKDLMEKAPELELTENGRVSKDTEQQDKAMVYFTERNIAALTKAEVPVTVENIYAAHFLGVNGAIDVLSSPDKMKLQTLVGSKVMSANNFKAKWKVSDFKQWLSDKVSDASGNVEAAQAAVDKANQ